MDEKTLKLTEFATTWWGKNWIQSMLKYGRFYRMQRAINYANDNRISDIIINKGEVFAQCQGTAPVPYRIKIRFKPLSPHQWDKVIDKMSSQAYFEANLLTSQMPKKINNIFVDVGVPLFPLPQKKFDANCNCPDNEIVCKHVAALILTLAKIFDYDPFKLFELRGMKKELLLSNLENLALDKDGNDNISILNRDQISIDNNKTDSIESYFKPILDCIEDISFNIRTNNLDNSIIKNVETPPEIENARDFMEGLTNIYKTANKYVNDIIFDTSESNVLPKKNKNKD